jgi:DNA polymerase-1
MSEKTLFLLDGMALVYRSHFAFMGRPIQTASGFNTSAIFGFVNTLIQLLTDQKPTHIAVVFDTSAPTARHETYAPYKGNREEMPEELSAQIPHVRRFIEAFRIPILTLDGYEADDLIGTLARRAESEKFITYMVTPDKDFGQLVTDRIRMYKPSRMGDGIEILGPKEILEKWEIREPSQVIDMLGLMGDSSDNIPGVPGIGQKTAQKLLEAYGSIENLLAHTAGLKGKQKENLETFAEQARLSKKLATILTDVPLAVDLESLRRQDMDTQAIATLCVEFEFNSLGRRLLGDDFQAGRGHGTPKKLVEGEFDFGDGAGQDEESGEFAPESETIPQANLKRLADLPHTYSAITDKAGRASLIERLRAASSFCFDLETSGKDAKASAIVGIAFCLQSREAYFVAFPEDAKASAAILEEFRPIFEETTTEKIGHNMKFDLTVLKWHGVEVRGKHFDTMVAHALVEPELKHGMDFMSEAYLGYTPIPIEDLIGEKKGAQKSMRDVPLDLVAPYACEDADVTLQLRGVVMPMLEKKGQEKVFYDIEAPLIRVLVDMEHAGIRVDTLVLAEVSVQLEESIAALEKQIYDEAGGMPFNISSARQLGDVLFGKLGLAGPKPKKTATGQFATDEQTLQGLAARHPIVRHILDYREASKLKSTYVDALPAAIDRRTGRVHTTYNQIVTATGRLNSTDPNLQNIPIRTELGREIRKAFVPGDREHELLSADYSQIELRIIAALAGDPGMLQAFRSGEDIHETTASKVFGVPKADVTADMRRKAKMVNFGIIYGISSFGLAQRLGIGRQEAGNIIGAYLHQYPRVQEYMDKTIAFARKHGYVETVTGRRRYLRDIRSANNTVRSRAERNAINTPIQGTAADMIKLAMVNVHRALARERLSTRMLLQVHDELVFELAPGEREAVTKLVEHEMKNAIPSLDVPIVVDIGIGGNWLEAH